MAREYYPFVLVQEEPPDQVSQGRPGVWVEQLRPLMEHQGVWFRVRESRNAKAAKSVANSLNRKETRVPDGTWSFRSGAKDGKWYVYARYDGPEEARQHRPRAQRAKTKPTTFRQWLGRQNERKDPVGELSRYAIRSADWPARGPITKTHLEVYIDKKGAPMSQWFVPAWKEYEESRDGA